MGAKLQKKQKGWVKTRDADMFVDKVNMLLPSEVASTVEAAVRQATTGDSPSAQELANLVASSCLQKASSNTGTTTAAASGSKCWELLAWFGLLLGNFKESGIPGTPEYCRRVELFEKFRAEHAPGDLMPLPAEPRGLLMVATNEKESDTHRRSALEHLNGALLD